MCEQHSENKDSVHGEIMNFLNSICGDKTEVSMSEMLR